MLTHEETATRFAAAQALTPLARDEGLRTLIEGLKSQELADRIQAARVLQALRKAGTATADELVGLVYGPLDPRLVKPAGRSLLSHLIKLEAEGQAARAEGEGWRPL